MTGLIGRVLTALVVLAIGTSPATAQRVVRSEASLGGVVVSNAAVGGLYLDAGKLVLPTTSVVAEIQLFPSVVNALEFVALGGVRQRLFQSAQGDLYAQVLLGGATGYSRLWHLPSASDGGRSRGERPLGRSLGRACAR
jgi:hypothetical protein